MVIKEQMEIKKIKTKKGVKAIEDAAAKIWTEHYIPIIGEAQVRYMLKKYQTADRIHSDILYNGYRYYAAFIEEKCIGYCAVKISREEGSVLISKCYVEKGHRKKGIARMFIERAISAAKRNRCGCVWLTVNKNNTDSIKAYEKLGFSVTDAAVTDIGSGFIMDDYIMTMKIRRR